MSIPRYIPKTAAKLGKKKNPTAADEGRRRSRNLRAALNAMPSGKQRPNVNAFVLPTPPPGVLPQGHTGMAMDNQIANVNSWAYGAIEQSFSEGLQFLGYPYLAELAQRGEHRTIVETLAGEMTRKWIAFEAVGEDENRAKKKKKLMSAGVSEETSEAASQLKGTLPEDDVDQDEQTQQRIKELNDEFGRLEVQDKFRELGEQDGYFGRSHLYMDFGTTDDRNELITPIGDGQNKISRAKIAKGSLERITTVEAMWTYPTSYDSINPLKPDWYNPQRWFVMGTEIHTSRLLTFVGRPVPDMLKPAYSFGGLAMTQIAKPYVDNWLETRQSVNDLIQSFVVWGLKTNLAETLGMQGEELFMRLELFNRTRNNRGVMAIDKETEEFFNLETPLGTLDALQAQAQEHMASISRIPLVKLLGIQPTGLNASSEGEIRVFYDTIHEMQRKFFDRNLKRLLHFVMLSLWGEVDKKITYRWEPLWSLDDKQIAEIREIEARTGQTLVEGGIIDPAEERARVAKDPDTPYHGIDPTAVPEKPQQEGQEGQGEGSEGGEGEASPGEGGSSGGSSGGGGEGFGGKGGKEGFGGKDREPDFEDVAYAPERIAAE